MLFKEEEADNMNDKLNYIMISPHFPTNFETFTLRLHEAGIRVLGIADEPYEQLSPALKEALTEYYRVNDMNNYDEMYRAVAFLAYKYGKIDRIESHNEHWLIHDARLRTDFNVFGFKNNDMKKIKYKSAMKEIFNSVGLKTANGRVVVDFEDAKSLAQTLTYPVILKPDSGVGAGNTYKIYDEARLKYVFEQSPEGIDYIMEEFIDGDIVTYDGLTDQVGNVVFSSSLEHNKAILDILIDHSDMFYWIPQVIDPELEAIGKECVKAFNIKERFFHFEFFRSKDDQTLMGLEINCRPPGGVTIDMFNYANEIDVFKEYANVVKTNEFKAEITRPYTVSYVARQNHLRYLHDDRAIREHLGEKIVWSNHVPGIFSELMGSIGYIVRAKDEQTLFEAIDFIAAKQEDE